MLFFAGEPQNRLAVVWGYLREAGMNTRVNRQIVACHRQLDSVIKILSKIRDWGLLYPPGSPQAQENIATVLEHPQSAAVAAVLEYLSDRRLQTQANFKAVMEYREWLVKLLNPLFQLRDTFFWRYDPQKAFDAVVANSHSDPESIVRIFCILDEVRLSPADYLQHVLEHKTLRQLAEALGRLNMAGLARNDERSQDSVKVILGHNNLAAVAEALRILNDAAILYMFKEREADEEEYIRKLNQQSQWIFNIVTVCETPVVAAETIRDFYRAKQKDSSLEPAFSRFLEDMATSVKPIPQGLREMKAQFDDFAKRHRCSESPRYSPRLRLHQMSGHARSDDRSVETVKGFFPSLTACAEWSTPRADGIPSSTPPFPSSKPDVARDAFTSGTRISGDSALPMGLGR